MGMSCGHVAAKVTFVRAPKTHVIRLCAVDDLRPASYSSGCPVLSKAITGAASVAAFPRHLMAYEYGATAGEASTVVACVPKLLGGGARRDRVSHTQVGRPA